MSMYGLSTGTKKVAVVERWRLVEVQLYKIVHISAHAQTSEVTIFVNYFHLSCSVRPANGLVVSFNSL